MWLVDANAEILDMEVGGFPTIDNTFFLLLFLFLFFYFFIIAIFGFSIKNECKQTYCYLDLKWKRKHYAALNCKNPHGLSISSFMLSKARKDWAINCLSAYISSELWRWLQW